MPFWHRCAMNPRWLAVALTIFAVACGVLSKNGGDTKKAEPDPYPRVDVAPWYEANASWPQRDSRAPWSDVPGVAVDATGRIWMYTRTSPAVQIYSPEGKYLGGWLNDTNSIAHQIKIDREGNVWLADIGLHIVRKHKQDGTPLMHIGTSGKAGVDETHLDKPTDMAIASNGDVFVADGYGNARIVHFDKSGKFINQWGTLGNTDGKFSIPHAIAIDSKDRIYVADRNNVRVQVYDTTGKLLDSWKDIIVPWGFCITDNDDIWVCGSTPMQWRMDAKYPGAPLGCPPKDQVFMRFRPDGRVAQIWSAPKAVDGKEKPGELNWLHCLALDKQGNIYAGDIIGKRLQKFVRHSP